ncbi:cytochrome-c peroxidase [Kistimonas asteriae]|uniref:cytochrome-c peroxidase n=1 Tax=Kistimonas asteriae TaxID=517724 RepID=UPI001BACC052|nr:cytochrome c peroxidase [Kistimonas asteriae]
MALDKARIALIALLTGAIAGSVVTRIFMQSDSFRLPELPEGFLAFEIPYDNQLTEARIALGKKLFYDPILSADYSMSCSSCHEPSLAFSDPRQLPISTGINNHPGFRNAPTLTNVAFHPALFWDGGAHTLEIQAQSPIEDPEEMGLKIEDAANRLKADDHYVRMSREAYDREPDPSVIVRALSAFERTLISTNSRYDDFFYRGNRSALTEEEQKGFQLFNGKAGCYQCHYGQNLTLYGYYNIGLPGAVDDPDPGLMRITGAADDRGKFRTPTLRNIALTGPYMHNGSMQTLEEVVSHFNNGGIDVSNKTDLMQPLGLTDDEQQAIVAFLKTLTDESFIANEAFKP